jgi:hypothetical protein
MGLLADDFFRLAHDDATGLVRLHERAVGIGLAAALLGELLCAGRIEVHDDVVYATRRRAMVTEPVSYIVYERIMREPVKYPVRTWLSVLSQDAYGQVASRLMRAGHLRRRARRLLFVTLSTTYEPVDMSTAAWPAARLAYGLRHRTPLSDDDVFLAGLAAAGGLDQWLMRDAENRDWAAGYLRHLLNGLAPAKARLVAHTHTAVGNALVSHHT